jgi:peptidoglycan/xylan/chitin deacetylase (PgdA/CDA1 family)
MQVRAMLKRLAYRSRAIGVLHRLRNRGHLTVAMFHRVLPRDSAEWSSADPTYTVSDRLFAECLQFFKRHYNVVSLPSLLAAASGGRRLPPRPLLITFDDGWADNEEVALPLLRRAELPAVVFVVSSTINEGDGPWWQETLFAAWRAGRLSANATALQDAIGDDTRSCLTTFDGVLSLAARLVHCAPALRQSLLAGLETGSRRRQMLLPAQLRNLYRANVAIGSHGVTHLPLTMVENAEAELRQSREQIGRLVSDDQWPVSVSFPHGRYTANIIEACRAAGYKAVFTSDPCLNPLKRRRPSTDVFGRVTVQASEITDATGRLRPDLLALWLFLRPTRAVA